MTNEVKKAVIIDYVRTPFTRAVPPARAGKEPGKLAGVHPAHMFGLLIENLLERTGANPADIKNVIAGCVHQEGDQGLNIARQAVLTLKEKGTLPDTVPAFSVDHFCGSSATTIGIAKSFIADGTGDLYIAGGVQSMSRIPMGGENSTVPAEVYAGNAKNFMNMGVTAENLVDLYGISREEQDSFSLDSHAKLAKAVEAGHYSDEITPVKTTVTTKVQKDLSFSARLANMLAGKNAAEFEKVTTEITVTHDDNLRTDSTLEGLAGLKPSFKQGGTVTPASSSPITDGASALLMASEDYAKANNLPVLAEVFASHASGCAPEVMGLGPVETIQGLLQKGGLTIDQIDAFEINEAFAGQVLAVDREMTNRGIPIPREKLNVDGGAIALGHPLGASGARLAGHLSKIMNRQNLEWGIAAMCIGGGQGAGVLIRNPNYDASKPKLTA